VVGRGNGSWKRKASYILMGMGIGIMLFIYWDIFVLPGSIQMEAFQYDNGMTAYKSRQLFAQEVEGKTIYANSSYAIYKSEDGQHFEHQFTIPLGLMGLDYLKQSKTLKALFNKDSYAGVELTVLDSGTILIFTNEKFGKNRVLRTTDNGKNLEVVHHFRYLPSGECPFILRRGITEDGEGNVYFAEYAFNGGDVTSFDPKKDKRDAMRVYCSRDDGKTWEVFYTFENIRHIHALQYDPYSGKIWVATGDIDSESMVGFFDPEDGSLELVGQGSQHFRVVSFIFTEEYILWGTDAPYNQNYIFSYHRETGEIEPLKVVDGPIYYSIQTQDGRWFLGRTVEGGAEGEWDSNISIWMSEDGGSRWEKFLSFERKDPSRFGYVYFPRTERSPYLIGNFQNSSRFDNHMLLFPERNME
jgi:hypothetical protein